MATNNAINLSSQGIAYYNGTGTFSGSDGVLAGYVLTSNGTGVQPTFQPPSGFGIWVDQAVSVLAVVGTNYFADAAITITLPVAPVQGDQFSFIVATGGSLVLQAQADTFIQFAAAISSSGGTMTNIAVGDSAKITYRAADATWYANNFDGNWTPA